ncbi:hypothetical protein [Pseudomonas sp. IsoF]|uniref:hypothetical protein n=1 Tax=Pseudomonas sp. IsoF TaxID=2821559 RepID=UPI003965BCE7
MQTGLVGERRQGLVQWLGRTSNCTWRASTWAACAAVEANACSGPANMARALQDSKA